MVSSPSICDKLARTVGALGPGSLTFTTRIKNVVIASVSLRGEPQESVIFEDVTMCVIKQKGTSLALTQKVLDRAVMLEDLAHVAFLGFLQTSSDCGAGTQERDRVLSALSSGASGFTGYL